ncbi:MAG TPA: response regulator transcription factor [Jiangellaceae bacterium]
MVADDVPLMREALARLLDLEADVKVVATVGGGDQIVDTALLYRPDVAVIDIALPKRDGLEAAAELRRRLPSCKTLILTGAATPGNLRRGAESQVAGFMLKDATPEDLVEAVRTVAAGGSVIDPQLAYAALGAPASPLTDRETSVLRMTADGLSTRDVAEALFLSHGTVRNYLASVVTKLCARNRVDAIRLAREAGRL